MDNLIEVARNETHAATISLTRLGLDPVEAMAALLRASEALDELLAAKQVRHCGHCHNCGSKLSPSHDGEEYCPQCGFQRYVSHGFAAQAATDKHPFCRFIPLNP